VLFWICIHYIEPNEKARVVPQFEEWNYVEMEKLAMLKLGTISDEEIFLYTMKNFTPYYGPLINRLQRVVFPGGGRRKEEDRELISLMKAVLEKARKDPQVSVEL
jgi:hypothetical protein